MAKRVTLVLAGVFVLTLALALVAPFTATASVQVVTSTPAVAVTAVPYSFTVHCHSVLDGGGVSHYAPVQSAFGQDRPAATRACHAAKTRHVRLAWRAAPSIAILALALVGIQNR